MEGLPYIGRMLIVIGIFVILAGFLLIVSGKIPFVGRLPGDIAFKKGHYFFYFPIITCLLISLIVTAILYLLRK